MSAGYAYKINWLIFHVEWNDLNSAAFGFQEDISGWVLRTEEAPKEAHFRPGLRCTSDGFFCENDYWL